MVNRQLLAVAFFIVMVELLVITLIVDATKNKIFDSLIVSRFDTEKTLASQVAHSLEEDLLGVQDMLQLAALTPGIQTGNAEVCQKELDRVFPVIEKKIANLVRINSDGGIYCAVNRASIGINVLVNEDLKNLIQAPEHRPVIHRVIFSPVSNKNVVGIHVPVFTSSGQFKGSIGGVVYIDELEEKYFKDFQVLKRGRLMLLDDNGDVLYHPVFPELVGKNLLSEEIQAQIVDRESYKNQVGKVLKDVKSNRPSFISYHYPPNPEMIAAYYPVEILPDRHWVVVVAVPVEDIIDQVDEDTLIAGFKNFTILSIGMVAVVLLTQIVLFAYLITHLSSHIKRMYNKQP